MSEVQAQPREDDATKVYKWRMCWLLSAGFSAEGARILTENPSVDFRYAMKVMESAKRKGYDEKFVIDLIT